MRSDPTPACREPGEAGISIVEFIIAVGLSMAILVGLYDLLDASRRDFAAVSDLVAAQATGRAVIELFGADARAAGYSPLGARFDAIPDGDASRMRLLFDLDGDGTVATLTESGETYSYVFEDPDGDGVYALLRGADLNGDWDFDDAGESVGVITGSIVAIDFDRDGAVESFLAYDAAPPGTARLTITFGVRTARRDMLRRSYRTVPFRSEVVLRNPT